MSWLAILALILIIGILSGDIKDDEEGL